jgi:hypothetical protein
MEEHEMAYEMEMLKQLMAKLQNEQKQAYHELATLPDGRLFCENHGGRTYYYHILGKRKDKRKKGITKEKGLVCQLARKEYLLLAIKKQEVGMKWIEGLSAKIDFDAWQDAVEEASKKFPTLIPEVFLMGDQYEPHPTCKSTMYIEGIIHRTQRGVMVRSKSELFIADMLESLGIPYQYEVELPYDDYHLCPDFTVVRPRDGTVIFWEHFGMSHNQDYLKKMDLKLDKYRNLDIRPWDNLMISYDREDGSLNAGVIRAMIEGWLK